MSELSIYTLIHSRYPVYDLSNHLPFSIVFGLCRRSSEDRDPRPLILDTKNSALDIPYALAHGLIKLKVEDEEMTKRLTLAIKRLSKFKDTGTYLTLPSPVNRQGSWKIGIVTFQYRVDPESELGLLLESSKSYEIMLSGEDLGIKWCRYGDLSDVCDHPETSSQKTGSLKLYAKPSHGRCRFTAVSSLPQPPGLHVQLAMETIESQDNKDIPPRLRISVTNTGDTPITIQTRGTQRFLVPWGPMEPEERLEARPRIIDASTPAPLQNLRVIHKDTGDTVRSPARLGPSGPAVEKDPRARLATLVTLKPGNPLIRTVDIGMLFSSLPDGTYEVQLEQRGLWWCEGDMDTFVDEGDDRVPHSLWSQTIPPLLLESTNSVDVRVEEGRTVG